jgi:hypothetical protein
MPPIRFAISLAATSSSNETPVPAPAGLAAIRRASFASATACRLVLDLANERLVVRQVIQVVGDNRLQLFVEEHIGRELQQQAFADSPNV